MDFDTWVISRLKAHGVYSGASDGVPGRAMIAGLTDFQKTHGLRVTGMADKLTVALLRADPKRPGSALTVYASGPIEPPAEPIWMREARRYLGLAEIPGPKSNPIIIGWAKRLGGWIAGFYTDDDIPWCGLFIGTVIATTLPAELLPANPLGALNWSKFGRPLSKPSLGAIMTFRRPGGGHVGIYAGEDATHYHILGGNQSNKVSITRVDKNRLDAIRWPSTGTEAPAGKPVLLSPSGAPVSRNEA